jgi:adenosylhomocysteine nucleosidase
MPRVAIVAALEREILPLVRHWRLHVQESGGRSFRFFEKEETVAVCGGIGAGPARRAAEAALALYSPAIVYSVGFAGALEENLKVGDIVLPCRVVDAADCSSVETGIGDGVLVTYHSVATPEQKVQLGSSFGAIAVDMEAAAVARAAEARGVRFRAVKAISDSSDSRLPAMDNFIEPGGQFQTGAFALHTLVRPWMYAGVARLARNSTLASRALCGWLDRMDLGSDLREMQPHSVLLETSKST